MYLTSHVSSVSKYGYKNVGRYTRNKIAKNKNNHFFSDRNHCIRQLKVILIRTPFLDEGNVTRQALGVERKISWTRHLWPLPVATNAGCKGNMRD